MTGRASMLAVAALVSVGVGCNYSYSCPYPLERAPSERVELGVDVDLHAVVSLDHSISSRYYEHLAVGEGGTIVAWGEAYSGNGSSLFVEVSQLGDADLRAIWQDYDSSTSWWVVGDAGTIVSSDNFGATWNAITLPGGDADLHAITGFDGRPLIVGDEVVLVRIAGGTWVEPPPPPGGWGSLRAVATEGELVVAVGLGGAAWSTMDPTGEWTAEPVGVETDLLDVDVGWVIPVDSGWYGYGVVVVGAEGQLLFDDSSGWQSADIDLSIDLIAVDGSCVLAADGGIYHIEVGRELMLTESIPGAEAINCDGRGQTTVGIGGLATIPPPTDDCG